MAKHFVGVVSLRSSKNDNGPPGEMLILELNPQRRAKILELTGWDALEPGTLNLEVDNTVVEQLLTHKAAFIENGETVRYPARWKHIPLLRKAYYYYRAVARVQGKHHMVMIRRAQVPLPGRVELFASRNLKDFFGIAEGAQVELELVSD